MASSSPESETIQSRWQAIHADCPDAVHLLAVSKGHPAIAVRELAALGQVDFGESRVQEALPKQQDLDDLSGLRWHFIGRLQANKVRAVVRAFCVIHSIDSQGLAERTSRIAVEENQNPEVFFQVKLRDDPAKGGWEPDALREVWPQLQSLPGLKPIGLMTMAPLGFLSWLPCMSVKVVSFPKLQESYAYGLPWLSTLVSQLGFPTPSAVS